MSDRPSMTSSLEAARAAARRLVLRSPFAPQARRAARLVESRYARRDRRDNEALELLVSAALAADASAIDIGANEGRVLQEIMRVAPAGRHIAYEPIPGLAADLRRRFPAVDVRCAALADEQGEADFTHVKSHSGYSGLKQRTYPGQEELEQIRVRIERLDDELPEGFVPAFVKIDVEGAEGGVLAGAIEMLERHKPLVVFEHGKGGAPAYGTTPGDVHALLADRAGLRIFDMDGGGPYSRDQLEEVFELGSYWNFFARS
ncbi:FkbM family methyltransferase [Conexibacter sp. CPCC 206217]|uniref:FkbM family methyltransferase n=1 Tax=Conexibacter sp. CPCC 206217 TaxID=3064574 RepID=UPI002727F801|nr:FkbM family methyltransferase [Conexibacter sp. CPCC 206217]MDO8209857.1 FkbM family methyltransferase [Conexibacter sp. CPCC 206217]